MLSPADMLLIGAAALIFFGPDQLPKVAKRAGQVVREVQNTSQSFIREMERAADDVEMRERVAAAPPVAPHVEEPPLHVPDHEIVEHHLSEAEMLQPFGDPLKEHAASGPEHKPEAVRHENYEI